LIREEKVFTGIDYGSAEQRCRELDFHGLCGDVRGENPEAPPPLFSLSLSGFMSSKGKASVLWMVLGNALRVKTQGLLVTE
jgi:hypothetical protein